MKIIKNLAVISFAITLFNTSASFAQTSPVTQIYNRNGRSTIRLMESNVKTERLPIGTNIQLRIDSPINSLNSSQGQPFIVTIINDIYKDNNLLLPSGTTVRGRIAKIKPGTFLSRGGKLALNLDLVETPLGRQLPIYANVSKANYQITNNELTAGGGYIKALQDNLNKGVDLLSGISSYCIHKGLSVGHGYPVILTAPLGVAGGAFAGGSVFFSKSVTALYHKGNDVILNPGDIIQVTLVQPLDVPLN